MNGKFLSWTCLQLLLLPLLPLFPGHAASRSIVKTLPGLSGDLPFTLETGYVSVEESELFYYFVESQGDPEIDPLILYINGGPGCSGLNGFLYQIGPLAFNTTKYKGGLPALILYPYSWTKTSSIIFLDAPVGAGFSYARSAEGYNVSDKSSASQAYEFLRKWLNEHRNFITNQLFIGSDSYSGLITPIIAQEILNGNEAGLKPRLNLKGYVIGSPHANQELQDNAQIPYAHRMALISDRLYESAKRNCKGNYVNIDPSNPKCLEDLEAIQERIGQVPVQNILYPKCATLSPKPDEEQVRRSLHSNDFWCWNFDYLLSDMWANDKRVQNALHVRKGTIKEWFRCNASLTASYTYDVHNAIGYHGNLTKTGLQVLLFSGDHDMLIPHSCVEDWIKSLDVPIDSSWRPWFVDGQVAGYTVKYKNIGYRLTYATVKGAGHSPEEFKRRECYEMFERWVHYYPL